MWSNLVIPAVALASIVASIILVVFKDFIFAQVTAALILVFYSLSWIISLDALGLSLVGLEAGKVWQAVTYSLLHSHVSFMHLFFNILMLLIFGMVLQRMNWNRQINQWHTIVVYYSAVVISGLFFLFLSQKSGMLIGASGGIFGLLGFIAVLNPEMDFNLFFMPFMRLTARQMAILAIMIEAALAIGFTDNIAHMGHIGGITAGIIGGGVIIYKH